MRGQLYEVYDYPYLIEKGKMLVLGLGITISCQRKKQESTRNSAELSR